MLSYGDIYLVAGGTYTSKPRPVLIVQDSDCITGTSVLVVPFTSSENPAILTRVAIVASNQNGLKKNCFAEVDKLSAINTAYIGPKVGHIEETYLSKVKDFMRTLLML